jgi:hypothetical protein
MKFRRKGEEGRESSNFSMTKSMEIFHKPLTIVGFIAESRSERTTFR